MPALPPVPSTVRIDYFFSVGTDLNALCRVFAQYTGGPPSGTTLNTMASDLSTNATTNLIPLLHEDNTLVDVTITDLNTDTGASGSHANGTAGGRTGNPLPADACVLMNAHISRRYRGGKPRTYWPFGDAADLQTPQRWSSDALGDFEGGLFAWYDYLVALSVSGTTLTNQANVSFYQSFKGVTNPITGRTRDVPTPRAAPVIDVVTSVAVNPIVGSQRRRTQIRT